MHILFFSRRRHTRCALVTGCQTCALPIADLHGEVRAAAERGLLPRLCANQDRCRRGALVLPEDGANPDARRRALLLRARGGRRADGRDVVRREVARDGPLYPALLARADPDDGRSEEHTSELQSLMRISYAVLCLKKKNRYKQTIYSSLQPHRNITSS